MSFRVTHAHHTSLLYESERTGSVLEKYGYNGEADELVKHAKDGLLIIVLHNHHHF